jgi:hypothetical protein
VPPRITIIGTDATLENVADARLTVRAGSELRDDLTMVADAASDRHVGPMAAIASAVRDAVRTGVVSPALATFADGLACDEVLDQLRAAPPAIAP